ncbi:g8729 [Coccomyxa elongata]
MSALHHRMADNPDLTFQVEGGTERLGFPLDNKGHVHVDSVLEEFQAKQVKYRTKAGVWTLLGAGKDGWSLASFTAPISLVILCTPRAVRGDIEPLCVELHKKGSTARNPPTPFKMSTPVLKIWWMTSSSKACSALKPKEGLALLGLPEEYDAVKEDAPLLPVNLAETLPESIRKVVSRLDASRPATIDDLFNHFAADLHLRQRVSDPVESPKEYTRREVISPVLYCAASLIPDIAVLAEAEVKGQRSHGTVDYVLDHLGVSLICVEAKLFEQLLDHLGQLCGEVRASHDVLRRKVLGKRKFGSISLSNEEEQALGKLKKFKRHSLPASMGSPNCKFQEVKDAMVLIVRHLMSLLSDQIKAAAVHLPESFSKRAKH